MNQKKSDLQIGKESRSLSPDLNPIQPPIHPKHLQILTHNQSCTPQKPQNHQQIQVLSHSSQSLPGCATSTPSSPTHQIFKQTQFRNEPICDNNPSASKTHRSSPQKRPIMSQTSSNLSHSPTISSLHHHHRGAAGLNSEPSRPSVLCFSSFSVVALATKTIALRVSQYLCCVRWVGVHLRFIILLSLPSLYFFTSNHGNTFFLHFLAVLAVSATLVVSLNLALPRFPSIRSLIARSFPIKLSRATSGAASKSRSPVVWSIGSKPKSEKGPHSGTWVQVYSNGNVYEGEFHKGKCSGSGVYYYSMSGRYEGDWVDGKYDGFGVETWAKGSRYRGHYRQGLRNGFGVYRFYTGDVYAGEWCNGQCHGCGVYTCEDGSQYVGEFRLGVKHGLGHYSFRNGDKYAGEYFADKMHGFGVYHFANGHRYEGAWHEGKRQGFGMYTFRNGDTQSGHWQNGVLDVSSVQGILPGSSFAVNHSKVINAVQEAQRAAEKAADSVGKVDERVNKAVAAANRSANAARVAAVKAVQNQIHRDNSSDDVPIQMV